jgi:hypothetical protein
MLCAKLFAMLFDTGRPVAIGAAGIQAGAAHLTQKSTAWAAQCDACTRSNREFFASVFLDLK